MGKWKPPHPARTLQTRNQCGIGQRYRTVALLRRYATPAPIARLATKLIEVECRLCDGYHLINDEELKRHRKSLRLVKDLLDVEARLRG